MGNRYVKEPTGVAQSIAQERDTSGVAAIKAVCAGDEVASAN